MPTNMPTNMTTVAVTIMGIHAGLDCCVGDSIRAADGDYAVHVVLPDAPGSCRIRSIARRRLPF